MIKYRHDGGISLPGLVPHTRHLLPDHLPELQAWLAETQGWDDNDNMESNREQTLRWASSCFMSQFHNVTMSPVIPSQINYHVTMSPCHHVTMSPCHHTMTPVSRDLKAAVQKYTAVHT